MKKVTSVIKAKKKTQPVPQAEMRLYISNTNHGKTGIRGGRERNGQRLKKGRNLRISCYTMCTFSSYKKVAAKLLTQHSFSPSRIFVLPA
jgi:hypothetical protein